MYYADDLLTATLVLLNATLIIRGLIRLPFDRADRFLYMVGNRSEVYVMN